MTRSLLADAFDHHVWATVRLIDTCADLSAEQLDTTVAGTFGSISGTLRHIVGADVAYLEVLDGAQPDFDEEGASIDQLRMRMATHQQAWERVLTGRTDPDAPVVRHRDDGSEGHAPAGVRLAQVIHHGSDHRSQVCTALTTIGVEPPEVDVWAFADGQGRYREVPPSA